jgi:hypothetical protein
MYSKNILVKKNFFEVTVTDSFVTKLGFENLQVSKIAFEFVILIIRTRIKKVIRIYIC